MSQYNSASQSCYSAGCSQHKGTAYSTPQGKLCACIPVAEESKRQYGILLYECYKPQTLKDTQDYINSILNPKAAVKPNEVEEFEFDNEGEIPPIPVFSPQPHKNPSFSEYLSIFANRNDSIRRYSKGFLIFDSNFECGNLEKVIARSEIEYDLYLCSDTNAPGRCQWFYFRVSNTRRGSTVKFNVVNLTKSLHFYKLGMKPLVFSESDYSKIYLSWTAKTDNVVLSKLQGFPSRFLGSRSIKIPWEDFVPEKPVTPSKETEVYMLSFTHTFKYDDDIVYFALHKPFSHTRMQSFVNRIEAKIAAVAGTKKTTYLQHAIPTRKKKKSQTKLVEIRAKGVLYRRETIGFSLGHVPIEMITITSSQTEVSNKEKSYVVITARVHAAETAGSYKMQGILKFLTGSDPVARVLRKNHVFLLVPTLNPDGVIIGNNRCSLSGSDLNRFWAAPHPKSNPEIHKLKGFLQKLCNIRKQQILLYCDLHGHSRLLNSFVYACHQEAGTLCSWTQSRLLPRLLAKQTPLVDFHQCSFKVEPDKTSTARVIVWKELKVVNSFTLETSQYGYRVGEEVVSFTERDYLLISDALMHAIYEYDKILPEVHTEYLLEDWLKPCNLVELAGIPAADVLSRELSLAKAEAKKRERMEKLRERCKKFLALKEGTHAREKSRAGSCIGHYKTSDNYAARIPRKGKDFGLPKTYKKKPSTVSTTRIEGRRIKLAYNSNRELRNGDEEGGRLAPVFKISVRKEKNSAYYYCKNESKNIKKFL